MHPISTLQLPPELQRAIAYAEPVDTGGGNRTERVVALTLVLATIVAAVAFALA